MTSTRVAALACAVCVATAVQPRSSAQAQQGGPGGAAPTEAELAEARHSFEVGMQAYDAGEYEAAASEFRAAYELTRAADLWFNVYLAEERAGRLPEAADALASYLRDATMEADQRALLERRLERLRARIAARTTQSAPPDETAEQRAEDLLARELIRDSADAIGSPVEPPPPGAQPPAPPSSSGVHPAAIGTLAGAGALLVAFAVLAPISELEDQALAARCGRDVGSFCDPGETSTLEALDIAADVSWIGAAALGVVGVVLLFALPPEGSPREQAASVAVAPWASPEGGGVSAGGRF